jgi:hypothetical protein
MEVLESRALLTSLNFVELESNDTLTTANAVPLGFDPGEDTRVIVNGAIAPQGDHDWFRVELNAGDVISGGVRAQNGLDPTVRFVDQAGNLLTFNDDSVYIGWRLLPPESPLSRISTKWTDAEFYYVVTTPGCYSIEVAASPYALRDDTGGYHLELVVARPGLESQPVGSKQIVFVDFDGAAVNTSDFGRGYSHATTGIARLSPLSSFLANWGLTAADENAVIDATLAAFQENLSEDIRAFGLNGDYASSGVPGQFDIEIRNSRDHADDFGTNPFVTRVVIGGTKEEFGANIPVAMSEVIDPGNFSFDDEAIVLLDDLSAANHVFSLNQYDIGPGHTKAELVGKGIGSIAVHETGHLFGNFHTELNSPSLRFDLMDGVPYSLDATVGVGEDRVFGTTDDIDVDFGVDVYNNWGVFVGTQDTLNTIAFGLATGRGIRAGATTGSGSVSSLGAGDLVAFGVLEAFPPGGIHLRMPDVDGTIPGLAYADNTRIDAAACLGGFVNQLTPLTELDREIGGMLGDQHEGSGVRIDALLTRMGQTPQTVAVDLVFSDNSLWTDGESANDLVPLLPLTI